jgi:DNA-binding transcriptional LysR family regulator
MSTLHGLTVDDFRLFAAVVDGGSISGAAAALGFSQSGMSRRVAAIEAAAGVPLLERRPRGVAPTAAGERLRGHARRVLEYVDLAERDLEGGHRGRRRLRLGAFSTANATIVPRALRGMLALEPGVDVSVREHRSATLLRWVGTGAIDAAIVSDYPRPLAPAADVVLVELFEDPLMVAVPELHPAARLGRVPFGLDSLADAPWIEGDPSETDVLRGAAAEAGFEPTIGHRVRDWNTKLAFVDAGLGVALVPALALATDRRRIAAHLLPGRRRHRVVSLAAPVDAPGSDLVDAFVTSLQRVVTSTAGHQPDGTDDVVAPRLWARR